MANFTNQLKKLRNSHGLTQEEAANKIGMKQQSYQKIESGKAADIKISTLTTICKEFGVSADWLLGLEKE